MRVLHWYPNFLHGGGVANAVRALAAAQARRGAVVAIAAADAEGPPLYEELAASDGVELERWAPRWTLRKAGLVLRRVGEGDAERLRTFAPDVVHAHAEFNPDNLWAARLFGCPIVLSPQGSFHPLVFQKSRPIGKAAYVRAANLLLYRRAVFHGLCPQEVGDIRRRLPRARIYCAPQGGNLAAAAGSARRSDDASPVRFLFVGRLDPFHKGLDVLVDAFARAILRFNGRGAHLALVGPDWRGSRAALEERAHALGIASNVSFLGPLAGEQVAEQLAQADVYVQLSRYEGLPLSVSEALLAGKPAILSDSTGTSSYPEIASLGHVRVVPTDARRAARAITEAVHELAAFEEAAARSTDAVREFFSWDRIADLHLSTYRTLR